MGSELERRKGCRRVNRVAGQGHASGGSEAWGLAFGTFGEQGRSQNSVLDVHNLTYWKAGLGNREQGLQGSNLLQSYVTGQHLHQGSLCFFKSILLKYNLYTLKCIHRECSLHSDLKCIHLCNHKPNRDIECFCRSQAGFFSVHLAVFHLTACGHHPQWVT